MLRDNVLKSRLQSHRPVFGMSVGLAHPCIAEMMGMAGFDFVLIDGEHGIGDCQDHLSCLQALAGTEARALLRVSSLDSTALKRALDLGVDGIMVPNIATADEARAVVAGCRYPPHGVRGYAATGVRASDYGFQSKRYLDTYASELLISVIIESRSGVENAGAIAAVDGIDLIQVGANDLAYDLGVAQQLAHPMLVEAVSAIEAAAKANGKWLGGAPLPGAGVKELITIGYGLITLGRDVNVLAKTLAEMLAGARAACPGPA